MSKTIVLLNPMGADVTSFVNGTPLIPQLLNGTVMQSGDTLYTLPYNNTSGAANITAGVALLDTKIRATSGNILVFGYSEGCQVADEWIAANYASSPPAVGRMSFLSIGNADRKYGGFAYHQACFSSVAYTGGLPNVAIPWVYTDFARQYDPVADFPQSAVMLNALTGLSLAGTTLDPSAWSAALGAVTGAVGPAAGGACVLALVDGLELVHTNYLQVTLADAANLWYTDPVTGVRYGLSPTYPVPSLGLSTLFPSLDQSIRGQVEPFYSRIFGSIPTQNVAPPPSQGGVAGPQLSQLNLDLNYGDPATASAAAEILAAAASAVDPTFTVSVYDYLWNWVGDLTGDIISNSGRDARNDLPTATLVIKGDSEYVATMMNCRQTLVGITISTEGQRWAFYVDTHDYECTEKGVWTSTANLLGIWDILNYMQIWPD